MARQHCWVTWSRSLVKVLSAKGDASSALVKGEGMVALPPPPSLLLAMLGVLRRGGEVELEVLGWWELAESLRRTWAAGARGQLAQAGSWRRRAANAVRVGLRRESAWLYSVLPGRSRRGYPALRIRLKGALRSGAPGSMAKAGQMALENSHTSPRSIYHSNIWLVRYFDAPALEVAATGLGAFIVSCRRRSVFSFDTSSYSRNLYSSI